MRFQVHVLGTPGIVTTSWKSEQLMISFSHISFTIDARNLWDERFERCQNVFVIHLGTDVKPAVNTQVPARSSVWYDGPDVSIVPVFTVENQQLLLQPPLHYPRGE